MQPPPERADLNELRVVFEAHHAGKLRLCEQLEAIADSLPDHVDPQVCRTAALGIVPTLRDAHMFEDSVLWPVLRQLRPDDERLEASLQRLHYEHLEDESYADELAAVLVDEAMVINRNAEATGYMLRGFFEALRRHIAFERDHILPILQDRTGAE